VVAGSIPARRTKNISSNESERGFSFCNGKIGIDMPELLPWHHMPTQDVLLALQTGPAGLEEAEAKKRLQEHGPNGLRVEPPTSMFKIFVRQAGSPLMLVLAVALLLSLVLGKYADSLLTLAVMGINVLMGFIQEYKADRALHALKTYLPATAVVRRGGHVLTIPAQEIVPGDILLLASGAKVTADARLVSVFDFATNESALTGESNEVLKAIAGVAAATPVAERSSLVLAGSSVVSGKAEAVVVATGLKTEFGKVTDMVARTDNEATPLQQELLRLSRALVGVMSLASVLVFLLGSARGVSFVEMLSTSAALAVASVPEGLLVSVTMILTVGMRRMLKRRALVRRLVAAETLGSVNILCVDKTGTLTTGEMAVTELRVGTTLVDGDRLQAAGQAFLRDLFLVNASHVEEIAGQPPRVTGSLTESGMMRYLLERRSNFMPGGGTIVQELPFDSEKKYSAKLVREQNQERALVMGAPDVLLAKCDVDDQTARAYKATLDDMTGRGLRVILLADKALARTADFTPEGLVDLRPLGLVGLSDPLRARARQTLDEAAAAGVRVIMITGDHPVTAAAIAKQLGLPTQPENILLGSELAELSQAALLERLRAVSVFARVLPEQKLRIVQTLQTLGYSVAMTGDGVNDAPALRAADIGVAVGSGTEVAKETADMVILDNDVHSLVAAIREGRIIFDNIRKVLTYLLTFSLSEVVLIAGILALGLPVPFAPLHILWINLVTDGLPSVALAFEPGERDIMQEAPRGRRDPLLTGGMRRLMLFTGGVAVAGLLLLYVPLYQAGYSLETLRSLLFLSLGLDSLLAIYPLRSLRRPFWTLPSFRNPQLLGAVGLGLVLLLVPLLIPQLQDIFGFAALQPWETGFIVALAVAKVLLIELGKAWFLTDVRKPKQVLLS
jgi:P-type Ca2+ transporter type 2C